MWLKSLKLREVCQHAELDLTFGPGIVGIVGPNGAGKTNIVSLAMASLTNDFSFKGRTRDLQIRRGSAEDRPSYVLATWVHGGMEFTVERSLRPNRNRLWLGEHKGKPTCAQAKDVQQALTGVLGVDPTLLTEYIYAPQWGIFSFLSDKPAARKDSLARLCGCEKADRLWNVLGEQIAEDQSLVSEKDRTGEIKIELSRWQAEAAAAAAELERIRKLLLPEDVRLKLEQFRQATAKLTAAKDQLDKAKVDLDLLQKRSRDKETALRRATASATAAEQLVQKHKEAVESAVAQLQQATQIVATNQRIAALKADLASPRPEVPEPLAGTPASELSAQVAVLDTELARLKKQLAALREVSGQSCPTCGKELSADELSTLRKELQQQVQTLSSQQESLSVQVNVRTRDEHRAATAIAVAKAALSRYETIHERAQAELATLEEREEPNVRLLTAVVSSHKQRTIAAQDAERTKAFCESAAKVAAALTANKQAEVDKLVREVDLLQSDLGDESVVEVSQKLANHYRVAGMVVTQQTTLKSAEENVQRCSRELAVAEQLSKRTAAARAWLKDLTAFRAVFHRDAVPREFMRIALSELAELTNERLNRFDVPFQMLVGDDADIQVRNADGSVEPASSKSGGEMVTLAIAYRLACGERFVHDIGCMALDEPTAGLDQHRLGCLESVLCRIGEVTRQSGQQIILITHDQRLERVFNHLIRLE